MTPFSPAPCRDAPSSPRAPRRARRFRARGALVAVLPLALVACAGGGPERETLVLHGAFGNAGEAILVEGRVGETESEVLADPTEEDAPRLNFRRSAALFLAEACDECRVELAFDGASAGGSTLRETADAIVSDETAAGDGRSDDALDDAARERADAATSRDADGDGSDATAVGPREGEPPTVEVVETDEAGFFRAELGPPASGADGWVPLVARSGDARRRGEALVVPRGNRVGIVSDIDDTVLVTEVGDSLRMLGNTFLRNSRQREAVPGMAALYARVLDANPRPEAAPLFYLSSSPRELHDYLGDFLARNDFPRGVLLTRRLTLDRIGYRLLDSVTYKTERLLAILERLPEVRFVLVGDDGEHDPQVYDAVRRRHPDRVADVWIRRVAPGDAPLPEGQRDIAEVLAREALTSTSGATPALVATGVLAVVPEPP